MLPDLCYEELVGTQLGTICRFHDMLQICPNTKSDKSKEFTSLVRASCSGRVSRVARLGFKSRGSCPGFVNLDPDRLCISQLVSTKNCLVRIISSISTF